MKYSEQVIIKRWIPILKEYELTYAEIIKDKRASTLTYFMARSLSWFKQIDSFEYESVMSDNGP
jgi:hypothetical protein